ncbi:MAG: glycerol-3-phosphate 1-O-acyltransferase PlsY, partial [Terracidiphilus sp.]
WCLLFPALFSAPPAKLTFVVVFPYIVIAVAAYLLGSIPVGYLLVRIFRRQDVRSMGSGNIGATNVLRAGGKGLGAATFLLDVLKGSSAVWLGGVIGAWLMPTGPRRDAQALAALFAVLGHVFTCWLRFRGGKGVATGFGVFLFAAPWAALAAIGTFAVICALTRYVSVGSIVGALAFLIFAWYIPPGPHPPFFFAVECFIVGLIVIKHHQNIRRLMAGTESRFGARKIA